MSEILGVMFAALLGLIMLPAYMMYEAKGLENTMRATTAQQMKQLDDAVQSYVKANYTVIQANSSAAVPYTISIAALQAANQLPTTFNSTNPYGQTWYAQVLQPTPGNLQAIVFSQGGTPIREEIAPAIAAQVGAEGGFVPYPNQYGVPNAEQFAQGSYAGWSVNLAGYSNPGRGHLASLLYFNKGNIASDYLYRVKVPGHPELNQMQTNIDMNNNDITNVRDETINRDLQVNGGTLLNGPSRHVGPTTFGSSASFDPGKYLYVDDIFLRNRNQWLSHITPKMVFIGAVKLGSQYLLGGNPVGAQQQGYYVTPPSYCVANGGGPKIDLIPQSIPDYSGMDNNGARYINYYYNWGFHAYWNGTSWYVVGPRGVPILANVYCYYP